MVKRLSLEQFEQIVNRLQLNTQTVEIAKRVLVDGDPQSALVAATGLTKGAISQAVNRVWSEFETKAKGAERLTVVLPEHQAYIVKTMGGKVCGQDGRKEMKTLVTANQKGGVGKTSTLVHLAFDFFERGLKVVVIDLDTQANASYTLQSFQSGMNASELFAGGVPNYAQISTDSEGMTLIESDAGLANMEKMTLSDAGRNFREAIQALDEQGYDVCLIDTAPSLGVTMSAALLAADFVISPIELEAYSIQGIKKMVTTIINIRKANPKLKFLGMVPSKVDSRNPRHGRHLEELNQAYPQLMVPAGIGLRSSIADALASCVPVWKIKKTAARKAAQEVRALAAHVYEKMEINNDNH